MSERYLVDENKNLVAYSEPSLVSNCKVVVVQASDSSANRYIAITSDLIDYEYVCFLASFSVNTFISFYINWDDENNYSGSYLLRYLTMNLRDNTSFTSINGVLNDGNWRMIQGSNMSGKTKVGEISKAGSYNFVYCLFQFMRAS